MYTPKLFEIIKNYNKELFLNDLIAGIVVAIIALPLSIALAIASGVGPNEGLYTAIIAGFIVSLFGGTRVQISGPTAAFSTIVANIVINDGIDMLIISTIIAGVFLIILGLSKLGKYVTKIPSPIIIGFTAGIALNIIIGQLKDFFGITYLDNSKPISTPEKLIAFINNIKTINIYAILIGLLTIIIILLIPKINKKIPSTFIAIIFATLLVIFTKLNILNISNLYTISNKPMHFTLPNLSLLNNLNVYKNGFLIGILCAIESLLACVVTDKLINDKHNSNAELIAQGLGNMLSVIFGGIPATGALARTTANVENGGKTPIAGMIHAVILFFMLIGLMKYVGLIPMPTIAAVLIIVGYNMSQIKEIKKYASMKNKTDFILLLICFIFTVTFDLTVGISISLIAYFIIKLFKKFLFKN